MRSSRLIAMASLGLLSGVASAGELSIFVLDDGGPDTAALVAVLDGAGHTVTLSSDGGLYEQDFDGDASGISLTEYEVVIWLDGFDANPDEMPTDGQDALVAYVEGGGGLVLFGDPALASRSFGYHTAAADLLLLTYTAAVLGTTSFTVTDAGSPIAADYGTGDTFSVADLVMLTGTTAADTAVTWTDTGGEQPAAMTASLVDGRVAQFAWLGGYELSGGTIYRVDLADADVQSLLLGALQAVVAQPPEVTLGEWSVEAGSEGLLTVDAIDPDGGEVTCTWDLDEDGVNDDATGVEASFDAAGYDGPTTAPVSGVCEDDEGVETPFDGEVTITNAAPLIDGISVDGTTEEGQELNFEADVADPDGDELSYEWDFGDDTVADGAEVQHTFTADGLYTVVLTVTDDDGGVDVDSVGVLIDNGAPAASASGPTAGVQGEVLDFECVGVDPGGDALSYTWDFGDGGGDSGPEVAYAFSDVGVWTVTCVVDDGAATGEDSLEVTISNAPPEVLELSVGGGVEGAAIAFSAAAEDPGGDAITYAWDFGDGATDSGPAVSHSYLDDGDYLVILTVSDGDVEVEVSDTAVVTNVDPVIGGSPAATGVVGVDYGFEPTVTDPGDEVFVWTAALPDAASADAASGAVSWTPSEDGVFNLWLEVSDGDGGSDRLEWTVTVGGGDVDGDGMVDSWEESYGLDPSDPSDASEDPDGDGRSNLDEFLGGSDPFEFGGPGVPEPISPLDGQEADVDRPTLTTLNTTDADGDALVYHFEVYADAGLTELITESGAVSENPGSTSWTVDDRLEENTLFWWRVSADDSWIRGDWSIAQEIFLNANEEAPGMPEPIRPWEGATVDAEVPDFEMSRATDRDRDALVHSVLLEYDGGAELGTFDAENNDGETVTVSPPILLDDGGFCWSAWATDEHGLTSELTESICFVAVTDNQAPAAPVIQYPADGDLVAEVRPAVLISDGVDPEGATVAHRFELDTSPGFDSEALLSAELLADGSGETTWTPGVDLAAEVTWYLRVAADDGLDSSTWATADFETGAGNRGPTPPTLVSPSEGSILDGPEVTLTVTGATDPDGDALTYDYEVWTSDGESLSFQAAAAGESVTVVDLEAGGYSWRASAVDDQGASSDWSTPAYFSLRGDDTVGPEYPGKSCGAAPAAGGLWLVALLGLARRRREQR